MLSLGSRQSLLFSMNRKCIESIDGREKKIDCFEYDECRVVERKKKESIVTQSVCAGLGSGIEYALTTAFVHTISIVCPMNVDASNWKRDLSSGVNVRHHHSTLSNAMLNHDIISEIIWYSTLGSIENFILYKNENTSAFSSSHHHSHFSRFSIGTKSDFLVRTKFWLREHASVCSMAIAYCARWN